MCLCALFSSSTISFLIRIYRFGMTFVLEGADGSGSFAEALCSARLFNSQSFSLNRAAFTV